MGGEQTTFLPLIALWVSRYFTNYILLFMVPKGGFLSRHFEILHNNYERGWYTMC